MTISAALAAALATLSDALDEGDDSIEGGLEGLIGEASAAITGFIGLVLVLHQSHSPAVIFLVPETIESADVHASLHLTLFTTDAGPERQVIDLILYSSTPGSLVDLGADLAWLLNRPWSEITVDGHLEPPTTVDGPSLLQAVSDVDQAIGLLIGRGYLPEEGRDHLETVAANEQIDLHSAARALLATLTGSDPRSEPQR